MKATLNYTSCEATSRSLNNCSNEQNTTRSAKAKGSFKTSVLVLLGIFSLFLFTTFHSVSASDRVRSAADILRQDVLRFIGPVTDQNLSNVSLPEDGFLVQLYRRNAPANSSTSPYAMLVRGVDPVEQALLQDAQDGRWDRFDLFRAALIAEGIRDLDRIKAYETKMNAVFSVAEQQLRQENKVGSHYDWTRELFEGMHRELLTEKYNIDCTNLSSVLQSGQFNCVSATILFNVLAERAGLEVSALEMPGHALSRVRINGNPMNLETTAPNWFALQSETARSEATLHRVARPIRANSNPMTGNPEPAATDAVAQLNEMSRKLREISPVQLIATVYYNQGVDFLNQKRYAESAMANIKALHLDPASETAWGNLLATINNWAIELTTVSKRYDLAATLLDQGVYLDPGYDKFRANQLHVYYHWIRDLGMEGRIDDAKTVYALADQRLPGDPDLKNLMQAIERHR